MRTTLTLDADVAARLERLRRKRRASLKTIVNEALRAGIDALEHPPEPTEADCRIEPVHLGARLPNLDDVATVLEATGKAVLS